MSTLPRHLGRDGFNTPGLLKARHVRELEERGVDWYAVRHAALFSNEGPLRPEDAPLCWDSCVQVLDRQGLIGLQALKSALVTTRDELLALVQTHTSYRRDEQPYQFSSFGQVDVREDQTNQSAPFGQVYSDNPLISNVRLDVRLERFYQAQRSLYLTFLKLHFCEVIEFRYALYGDISYWSTLTINQMASFAGLFINTGSPIFERDTLSIYYINQKNYTKRGKRDLEDLMTKVIEKEGGMYDVDSLVSSIYKLLRSLPDQFKIIVRFAAHQQQRDKIKPEHWGTKLDDTNIFDRYIEFLEQLHNGFRQLPPDAEG